MLTQVNHPQQQLDICDDRLLNLSIRFYAGLITPECLRFTKVNIVVRTNLHT